MSAVSLTMSQAVAITTCQAREAATAKKIAATEEEIDALQTQIDMRADAILEARRADAEATERYLAALSEELAIERERMPASVGEFEVEDLDGTHWLEVEPVKPEAPAPAPSGLPIMTDAEIARLSGKPPEAAGAEA